MSLYNPQNERLKRAYFEYAKEAEGKSPATVNGIRRALALYEKSRGIKRDFWSFSKQDALEFKESLEDYKTKKGSPMSEATRFTNLRAVAGFYKWLALQPGYKSKIREADIEYFNMQAGSVRAAKAGKFRKIPTLEQIRQAIAVMPAVTEIERRDRTLMSCAILTGARVSALASLRLRHVDLENRLVKQEPDQVRTKGRKRIDTFFFPVGLEPEQELRDWVKYLREERGYGDNDPLFPRTKMEIDKNNGEFRPTGLERECWQGTGPINKIFRQAFSNAGLPYFTPHSFRYTLVGLGQKVCQSPEDFKVWSQCLGHAHVMTTFTSYGNVEAHRQGEVMKRLSEQGQIENKLDAIYKFIKEQDNKKIENPDSRAL